MTCKTWCSVYSLARKLDRIYRIYFFFIIKNRNISTFWCLQFILEDVEILLYEKVPVSGNSSRVNNFFLKYAQKFKILSWNRLSLETWLETFADQIKLFWLSKIFHILSGKRFFQEFCSETCQIIHPDNLFVLKLYQIKWIFSILAETYFFWKFLLKK